MRNLLSYVHHVITSFRTESFTSVSWQWNVIMLLGLIIWLGSLCFRKIEIRTNFLWFRKFLGNTHLPVGWPGIGTKNHEKYNEYYECVTSLVFQYVRYMHSSPIWIRRRAMRPVLLNCDSTAEQKQKKVERAKYREKFGKFPVGQNQMITLQIHTSALMPSNIPWKDLIATNNDHNFCCEGFALSRAV